MKRLILGIKFIDHVKYEEIQELSLLTAVASEVR